MWIISLTAGRTSGGCSGSGKGEIERGFVMGNTAYIMDDRWDEMLNGQIVAMSPRPMVNHNRVAGNISAIFNMYLEGKKCEVFSDGVDLYLTPTDRFVPDGMIVCDKDKIKPNGIYGSPDLVIEVLSPTTAKNDKGYKKQAYEKAGVKEYWIVDINSKSIEVYLLKDGIYDLDFVYSIFPDYMIEKMNEEERASIIMEFHCSLFPDLTISLKKVFDKID